MKSGWECVVIQLTLALSNAFFTQVLGISQCSEQTLKEAFLRQADPGWGAQCTESHWGTPGAAKCTLT